MNISLYHLGVATCFASEDGFLDISVSGGTSPYTYAWSTGANTEDIDSLAKGFYTLTLSDANGCTLMDTFEILEPDSLEIRNEGISNLTCNASANGSIEVSLVGGNRNYDIEWSNGSKNLLNTNLEAGTYTISVQDVKGCAVQASYTVSEPDVLQIDSVEVQQLDCFADGDARIEIAVAGGTGPYAILWSNGDSTLMIESLEAGVYSVTVSDTNNCTAQASFEIVAPEALSLNGTEVLPETCDNTQDGYIDVKISGGTAPYTITWSIGDTSFVPNNLSGGSYYVTVVDAKGCVIMNSYDLITLECNDPPVAVDDTVTTSINTPLDIPVIKNDYDPDGDKIFVTAVTQPSNGTTSINSDGTINYTPNDGFTGLDTFYYWICDDGLPSLCDDAMVIVNIMPSGPNFFIPNGFSPNGDGINDYFEVDGILEFPDNEIIIFNRWGNMVYEGRGYQNDWAGVSQSGNPLPDGTYYYIIKLKDDRNTVYSGFVMVHRALR